MSKRDQQSNHIKPQDFSVTRDQHAQLMQQKPRVIWMSGYSGAGKSALANALQQALYAQGQRTVILDGDQLRSGLCNDLGFSDADRHENMRRVREVAKLMYDAGLIVIVAFISPFAADRRAARDLIGEDGFLEVHVNTSLSVCEARDVKGLYKKARAGEIAAFTGISSPYEKPENPDVVVETDNLTPQQSAQLVLQCL